MWHRLRASAPVVVPALLVAAVSLFLRAGFPVFAIYIAMYDDALFIRLATALRSGDWLGAYDHLTLAKGMFYPLFIAVMSFLHIPLKFAEHAGYLGAAAVLAFAISRAADSRKLGLA